MTTWREYKAGRPLRGEARRAYERARRAMGVGYLILKARAAAGMTQDDLARAVGTSQSMVARWEGGVQVPSVRTLMKVAQATGFRLTLGFRDAARGAGELLALGVVESAGSRPAMRIVRERATPYAVSAAKRALTQKRASARGKAAKGRVRRVPRE